MNQNGFADMVISKNMAQPSAQKSRMMSRIRTKGTAPELALRSALHSAGFRFRLHRKNLPGKPDILLPKYRIVIFVHGCFWHHHEGCSKSKLPATNKEFWNGKIAANVERDKRNLAELEKLGWRIAVVWECSLKNQRSKTATVEALFSWVRTDLKRFESVSGNAGTGGV